MNPIAATLQKPAPQPDRDVSSSQPEADAPNPPPTRAQGGFADALRAASGQPASPRASTGGSEAVGSDGTTKSDRTIKSAGGAKGAAKGTVKANDPAPALPGIPAAPLPAADPASAAAAILANILNAVTTAIPTAGPAGGADDRAGTVASAREGTAAARGAPALPIAASAPGSTAGPGSVPQDETDFGLTNAVAAAAPRRGGTDSTGPAAAIPPAAGPAPAALPTVTVLDRATHFKPVLPDTKPVLPDAAPAGPVLPTTPAPAKHALSATPTPAEPALSATPVPIPGSTPGSADGIGAKLQRVQIELPAPVTAAAPEGPVQGSAQASAPSPPQPASDSAGAAVRAAGAGLEKADVAALSDIRAVSGVARAGLGSDKRSGETEAAGLQAPDTTGMGLPAGTLPTIAAAIRGELDRAAGSEPAARAPQTDPAAQTAPDGPLRVLRIQLRPDDLGTVTVELRLANGQLETHLRASQPETAALLHRDAAILTDLLKQANYQAEVTVSQARPSDLGGFSGNAPSQGQPGFSDGGARPGQGGDRQRQADRSPAAGRREGERGDDAIRPRDGGVYL